MQAWEEKYYEREEGREEGRKETLMRQIQKKLNKGKDIREIADALEEDEGIIREMIEEMEKEGNEQKQE